MFLDTGEITVRSGRGGNGIVAFRREAYVPLGGPSGGNGGNGGHVYLRADPSKRTLLDFKYQHLFRAENGQDGGSATKTGRSGKHLYVPVPPGTLVWDAETGELLADLVRPGDTLLAVRGGRGGRGNAAFATPTRQAPRFAELGEPAQERRLRLELKLIADVGIVGFPNVGKSTLISRISAARPRIASYPFTTLEPNLGVVQVGPDFSFVVADVPGLIEGAHQGAGLGHQFLRHVERTRLLIHMVDIAATEGRDPLQDYHTINRELALHNPALAQVPQVVALNKMDVLQDPQAAASVSAAALADGRACVPISAVTGEGIPQLIGQVTAMLRESIQSQPAQERGEPRQFEAPPPPRQALDVRRVADGVFTVRGTEAEAAVQRTRLDSRESLEWLHGRLEALGVMERLEELGAQPGDTVFIGPVELEYVD